MEVEYPVWFGQIIIAQRILTAEDLVWSGTIVKHMFSHRCLCFRPFPITSIGTELNMAWVYKEWLPLQSSVEHTLW